MSEEQLPADSGGKMVVFGAKQIRCIWVDGQWFFSVVDIIAALTDSENPRNYWNMMKAREREQSEVQLSTFCVQLKLRVSFRTKSPRRKAGTVAGGARRELDKSGRKVVTRQNYLADKPKPKLPPKPE